MKRYFKIFIVLLILTIFYLYIANLTLMPKSITLLEGEKIELATAWGVSLKKNNQTNFNIQTNNDDMALETSSNIGEGNITTIRKDEYGCKFV